MVSIDSVVGLYEYNNTLLFAPVLGVIVTFLMIIISFLFKSKQSKTPNSTERRKKRDDILREIQTVVLKDHATLEGLTLLVGALTRKVENFEAIVNTIDQKINDRIVSHTENLEVTLGDIGHEVDQMKNDLSEKFGKIQRNFALLSSKLGDFTDNEYRKSMANITEQVREMKGAIFLPDEEDDNDSDYQE